MKLPIKKCRNFQDKWGRGGGGGGAEGGREEVEWGEVER